MNIRNRILPYVLPVIFFLLPWQTRYIFGQQMISGEAFGFGVMSLYLTEILIILALIFYWRLNISEKFKKIVILSFLILLISFLSIFWSVNIDVAFGQFIHLLCALILFFLLLDSRTKLKYIVIGFVSGLIIPISLGVFQVIVGGSGALTLLGLATRNAQTLGDSVVIFESGIRVLRAYGSFSHPNIFGGYLVVGFLSLLLFPVSFLQKQGFINQKELNQNGVLRRILWWILTFLLFIGLILTYSQSAWLAVIIALVCGAVILFFEKRDWFGDYRRFRLKIVAVMFFSVIMLSSIFGVLTLDSIGFNQSSITERAEQYQEWPQIISDSWLFGAGLGNYTYALEQSYQSREWWQYQPVHNIPMLIIGEIGIIGFGFVTLWLALIFFTAIRVSKTKITIYFMMSSVVIVLASLDHYLWTQWVGMVLVVYTLSLILRLDERFVD